VTVGKCLDCKRLFACSEKTDVGALEIAGERFRIEICPTCRGEMSRRKKLAAREACA
jgi:hypothetical protein